MNAENCIFCAILEGRMDCSPVAEDTHAFAFMDVSPINPGHVLVIPKRHVAELTDLSDEELVHTMRLVRRVAGVLGEIDVRCEGYNLFQANGAAAGQEVFHVHFHLVPRFAGDALRIHADPNRPRADRSELDRLAAALADRLA